MAFLDKSGHEICAQKKNALSSFVYDGKAFKRLARRNTSVGAPNDVLSIRVEVSRRRGQQEAHSRKMLPHRVQILTHCVQILPHCLKMPARNLGEPLIPCDLFLPLS